MANDPMDNAVRKEAEARGDGGNRAFAGFFYQIFGALALRARAIVRTGADSELDIILAVARDAMSTLEVESHDFDAAFRRVGLEGGPGVDERAVMQFKYSSKWQPPNITPSDLLDIVDTFVLNRSLASEWGDKIVVYSLITNRQLTKEAKELWQTTQAGGAHAKFKKARHHKYGPTEWRAVMPKLRIPEPIDVNSFYKMLLRFAGRYGCLEEEVQKATNELLGYILKNVGIGNKIYLDQKHFIEAYTGYDKARPITIDDILLCNKQELDSFSSEWLMVDTVRTLRRDDLLSNITSATMEHALVMLYGEGGCGKSACLWQWVTDQVKNGKDHKDRVATVKKSTEVQERLIAQLISDWRDLPRGLSMYEQVRCEPDEQALQRFINAQVNDEFKETSWSMRRSSQGQVTQHVIHIVLDGIDEQLPGRDRDYRTRDTIVKILRTFWNMELVQKSNVSSRPPAITLVVSCRKPGEVEEWLGLDKGGGIKDHIHQISVDAFSDAELREVVQQNKNRLSIGLADRIVQATLRLPASFDPNYMGAGTQNMLSTPRSARVMGGEASSSAKQDKSGLQLDIDLVEAIKHPIVWRLLLDLDENSQELALQGDRKGKIALGEKFLNWFCSKARHRGSPLEKFHLLSVMRPIALDHDIQGSHTFDAWRDSACQDNFIDKLIARELYTEALLAGLISEEARNKWRWRHGFAAEYLASLEV